MSQNKWDLCIKTLQAHVSEQAFRTWFAYLKFVSLDADKLVIGAPNKFVIDYIEGNYLALLQTSIKAHFGNVKVAYSSDLHLLNTKIQLLSNRTQKVWIIASSWQDKT